MRPIKLVATFVCLIAFGQLTYAQCKKPKVDDVPHGANEFIMFTERRVGHFHGRIFFPNYMIKTGRVRAKNIVVELYNYSGSDSYQDVSKVLREQKRVAACLTGADGRFSFAGLKPGRYLFRAGTREPDEFNKMHGIIIVEPKLGVGKGLDIVLSAGT